MPRARSFEFSSILIGKKRKDIEADKPVLSIYKNGQMLISRSANHTHGLDGRAVEFVYDEKKKALGMKHVMHTFESPSWDKQTMRLLKEKAGTGQIQVSVGRIMGAIGLGKIDFKGLAIEKYTSFMDGPRDTFVMILKEEAKAEEAKPETPEWPKS